ncbi:MULTISPECIES: glycosyl hydrolase family 8 [Clostridium]|uniref:glycosyl hydrolase family 8 n=1 Tax=Clostridium TaxID=1485 RepID=UPI000824291D|nr:MULTISPECIES: glycosyl hydrolase family 8 [Clostridium]
MKLGRFKIFPLVILTIISLTSCVNTHKKIQNKRTYGSDYYNYWKKKYVVSVNSSMSKVVNPENNKITVSEGMGYGLLFSAAYDDKNQFDKLWNYTKHYLDNNGLMNWKINSNGNISGYGSASDADEDIAYALLLAAEKWPNASYNKEAVKMINAIKSTEISKDYILLPGDSWGNNPPFNPSYVSPYYYYKFAALSSSEKNYWEKVLNVNVNLLNQNIDKETGLLPDWINKDGTIKAENNKFGYDAVRVPLRLIEFYNETHNSTAKDILERENDFLSKIGSNKLVSGYSTDGKPLANYINSVYLSSFSAASLINKDSNFSKEMITKLKNSKDESYYGCSLKMWVFLILDNKLN